MSTLNKESLSNWKVKPIACDHKTRKGFPVMQLTDEGLRCDICYGLYTWKRIAELLSYEPVESSSPQVTPER